MTTFWVLTLGLVALTTVEGCKRQEPEPIPAPKAVPAAVGHVRAAGIAWFQGSLDEAFARPSAPATCSTDHAPIAPLVPDLSSRIRNRQISPAPTACSSGESCPATASPRRPLV
jgi:hypothetical protein